MVTIKPQGTEFSPSNVHCPLKSSKSLLSGLAEDNNHVNHSYLLFLVVVQKKREGGESIRQPNIVVRFTTRSFQAKPLQRPIPIAPASPDSTSDAFYLHCALFVIHHILNLVSSSGPFCRSGRGSWRFRTRSSDDTAGKNRQSLVLFCLSSCVFNFSF